MYIVFSLTDAQLEALLSSEDEEDPFAIDGDELDVDWQPPHEGDSDVEDLSDISATILAESDEREEDSDVEEEEVLQLSLEEPVDGTNDVFTAPDLTVWNKQPPSRAQTLARNVLRSKGTIFYYSFIRLSTIIQLFLFQEDLLDVILSNFFNKKLTKIK